MANPNYKVLAPGQIQPVDAAGNAVGGVINVEYAGDLIVYDTIEVGTAPTAGQTYNYFQTFSNKNYLDTNCVDAHIPQNNQLELHKVGVQVMATNTGSTEIAPKDLKNAIEAARLYFTVDGTVLVNQPIVTLPSGFGVYGMTQASAQGVISSGIPSTAGVAERFEPQVILPRQTLQAQIVFDGRTWGTSSGLPTFGTQVLIRLYLIGVGIKPGFLQ